VRCTVTELSQQVKLVQYQPIGQHSETRVGKQVSEIRLRRTRQAKSGVEVIDDPLGKAA